MTDPPAQALGIGRVKVPGLAGGGGGEPDDAPVPAGGQRRLEAAHKGPVAAKVGCKGQTDGRRVRLPAHRAPNLLLQRVAPRARHVRRARQEVPGGAPQVRAPHGDQPGIEDEEMDDREAASFSDGLLIVADNAR